MSVNIMSKSNPQYPDFVNSISGTKLSGLRARNKLVKALINRYYVNSKIKTDKTRAFLPSTERWKLVMITNILCYRLNPGNPFQAFRTSQVLLACLLNDNKRDINRLQVASGESGEKDGNAVFDTLICPCCGESVQIGKGINWHSMKDALKMDKFGQVKYEVNTTQ